MTDICLLTETCHNGATYRDKTKLECVKRNFQSVKTVKHKDCRQTALANRQSAITTEVTEECERVDDGEMEGKEDAGWGKITNDLVQLSTFPFLFLSIPQLLQNAVNLSNGNFNALSILSWKGFMTALAGNSILLSYFLKKQENGAAVVQAIGVVSNFILLVQIYMAGLLPGGILWGIASFIGLSTFINSTVVLGTTRSWNWLQVTLIQRLWETFLSVLGLSLLVHALWSTVFPQTNLFPAFFTAGVSLAIDIMHWRDLLGTSFRGAWTGISAWTATFLFAFQPIGQLVCNIADPSSLAGLSLNTILLAMMGNGLMVPRALHTRDKIWLTGTLWSSLMMGWAQLLCLYVGSLVTGSCYLSGFLFYFLTLCAASYFFTVFKMEAKTSNLKHPLESLVNTYLSC